MSEEEHYYHKSLPPWAPCSSNRRGLNSVIQKYAEEQRQVTMAIVEASEEYKREMLTTRASSGVVSMPLVRATAGSAGPGQLLLPRPPASSSRRRARWARLIVVTRENGYATSSQVSPLPPLITSAASR